MIPKKWIDIFLIVVGALVLISLAYGTIQNRKFERKCESAGGVAIAHGCFRRDVLVGPSYQ